MSVTLYLAKNLENKVKYVGITSKPLKTRIKDHFYQVKRGSQFLIHKALRKHDLVFEAFLTAPDWQIACELEIQFIKEFKTHVSNGGYNLTTGGEGNKGHIKSPELCKSISDRMQGISPFKGRRHTEETKNRIKKALKGKICNPAKSKKLIDNFDRIYSSIAEAARQNNLKKSTIHLYLKNGKTFPCGLKFTRLGT